MPIFTFTNAGIELSGMAADDMVAPVPLGIAAGLFFGKQVRVMGAGLWLAGKTGVALLTGIGFTMSLFIGMLAFPTPNMLTRCASVCFPVRSPRRCWASPGCADWPVCDHEAEAHWNDRGRQRARRG